MRRILVSAILPLLLVAQKIVAEITVTTFVLVPLAAPPFLCDKIKASGIRTAAQACLATSCHAVASHVGLTSAECCNTTTLDNASGLLCRGGFISNAGGGGGGGGGSVVAVGSNNTSSVEQCIQQTLESTQCLSILQRVHANLTGLRYVSALPQQQQQTPTPTQSPETPPPVVVPPIDRSPSKNATSTKNETSTTNSTSSMNVTSSITNATSTTTNATLSPNPTSTTNTKRSDGNQNVFPIANSTQRPHDTPSTNYSSTAGSDNNNVAKGAVIGLTIVIVLLLVYAVVVTNQRRRIKNDNSKQETATSSLATENKDSETGTENDGDISAEVWTGSMGFHNPDSFRPLPTVHETTAGEKVRHHHKRWRDWLPSGARNHEDASKPAASPVTSDISLASGSHHRRSPLVLISRTSDIPEMNVYCEEPGKDAQSLGWSSTFEVPELEDAESCRYE